MAHYLRTIRLLGRDVHLLLFAWGMVAFGYFGIQGVLFNLYILRLGYGPEFIGLLNGSGMLAWAIFCLPAGLLGARIGSRNATLAGGILITTMNSLVLLVGALPESLRSAWLICTWILNWTGVALLTVNSTPLLMKLTSPGERGHAFAAQAATMSALGLGGSLAAGILPAVFATRQGVSLDQPGPYWAALWLAPAFYLLAVLAIWATHKEKIERTETGVVSRSGLPVGFLLFFGWVTFLGAAGEGSVRAFFNLYLDDGLGVPAVQIGSVMGLSQVLPILAALTLPVFITRWGATRTFGLASLGLGLSLVTMGIFPNLAAAGVGFAGVSAMASLVAPARSVSSQESVLPRWGTAISGAVTMGLALGWAAMAFAGGYLIEALGYNRLFLVSAMLALLSAVCAYGYLRFELSGRLFPRLRARPDLGRGGEAISDEGV